MTEIMLSLSIPYNLKCSGDSLPAKMLTAHSSETREFPKCVLRNLGVGSVNFGVKSTEGELLLLALKSCTVKK